MGAKTGAMRGAIHRDPRGGTVRSRAVQEGHPLHGGKAQLRRP